ncbi:hypothetical protein ACA910_010292 [Epithemia clementina (nom. ined.)]
MIVETPQILWNAAEGETRTTVDRGHHKLKAQQQQQQQQRQHRLLPGAVNAALYSLDLLASGLPEPYHFMLVTAGNASVVNVWSLLLPPPSPPPPSPSSSSPATTTTTTESPLWLFQRKPTVLTPVVPSTTTTANANAATCGSATSSGGGLQYRYCLGRRQQGTGAAISCAKFSPNGLHLAVAYDAGTNLHVYSVPWHKRGNGNGRHYWAERATQESDFTLKLVRGTGGEGIVDVAWWCPQQQQQSNHTNNHSFQRLLLANIDHSVCLVQRVVESTTAATTTTMTSSLSTGSSPHAAPPSGVVEEDEWQVVCRISEHSHFVQGVAYDPLGVYLASMSNDRSVRLYPRKATAKTLKKVVVAVLTKKQQQLAAQQQPQPLEANEEASPQGITSVTHSPHGTAAERPTVAAPTSNNNHNDNTNALTPQQEQALALQEWIATTKFELAKTRVIKYAPRPTENDTAGTNAPPRHCWFADESTVESFFRRLAWTVDGRFLLCPTALYKPKPVAAATTTNMMNHPNSSTTTTNQDDASSTTTGAAQNAVLVFARHNFDEPYKILTGLTRPAVAIRPNPVLFELPQDHRVEDDHPNNDGDDDDNKENTPLHSSSSSSSSSSRSSSYRSLFCVLTWDSVLLYDTYSSHPLAVLSGLHYANLTDAAWTPDGHDLLVSSSDGYVSLIRFAPGELGTPISASSSLPVCSSSTSPTMTMTTTTTLGRPEKHPQPTVILPPCEPGPVQLPTQRPFKKIKVATTTGTTTPCTVLATGIDPHKKDAIPTTTTTTTTTIAPPEHHGGTKRGEPSTSSSSSHDPQDDHAAVVAAATTALSITTGTPPDAAGSTPNTASGKTTMNDNDTTKKNHHPQEEDEIPKKKKKRIQPTLVVAGA